MIEIDTKEKMDRILSHYSGKRDELIPIMQEAQEEFRYLPQEVMQRIAKFLKISESTVFGVATFYALFKLAPSGKKVVRVCRGTACHVRGGAQILRDVQKRLGIKPSETTKDWEYTLETVACIGACALAPNLTINNAVYGRMTPTKVDEILGAKR